MEVWIVNLKTRQRGLRVWTEGQMQGRLGKGQRVGLGPLLGLQVTSHQNEWH